MTVRPAAPAEPPAANIDPREFGLSADDLRQAADCLYDATGLRGGDHTAWAHERQVRFGQNPVTAAQSRRRYGLRGATPSPLLRRVAAARKTATKVSGCGYRNRVNCHVSRTWRRGFHRDRIRVIQGGLHRG